MERTTQIGAWIRVLTTVLLTACTGGGDDGENASNAPAIEEPKLMPDPTPVKYPPVLWDQGVEGETEVLVEVSEVGDIVNTSVAQTSGYAEFDSAALEGVRRLRFTPGKRGDKPVAMRVRIPVRFARDSSATVGTPRSAGTRND
jgi:protein TonB